jgi:hypothetical protein
LGDATTDLYALAVSAIFCYDPKAVILVAMGRDGLSALPCHGAVKAVFRKALSFKKAERFRDAHAFIEALKVAASRSRTRDVAMTLIVIAAVAAASAATWMIWGNKINSMMSPSPSASNSMVSPSPSASISTPTPRPPVPPSAVAPSVATAEDAAPPLLPSAPTAVEQPSSAPIDPVVPASDGQWFKNENLLWMREPYTNSATKRYQGYGSLQAAESDCIRIGGRVPKWEEFKAAFMKGFVVAWEKTTSFKGGRLLYGVYWFADGRARYITVEGAISEPIGDPYTLCVKEH